MKLRELEIKGVFEMIPEVYLDNRGFFFESYNQNKLAELGLDLKFVQDNQSYSKAGVLRGLHFQREPYEQGKLVRVIKGRILDVAVDINQNSPTFGKHVKLILDSEKNNMIYIPGSFAHGFYALEESIVLYKCTKMYSKEHEGSIIWNDPELNIDWGTDNPIISEKDLKNMPLSSVI